MTCLACAERGHATRTGKMSVRCPVAGTPRLVGQNCAYSEGAIWAHVEAARDRLKLLESLHPWAHAKAEEAAYWDAAVGKPVSVICKVYTSQRGVFRDELTSICRTCANHEGEYVCVTECNLGSKYERRGRQ